MRRCLAPVLVVVNLALCICAGFLWFDESGNTKNVHWVAPDAIKPEIPDWPKSLLPSTEVGTFLNVLERPLFSPSRRPPPPPPPPVAPPPPDPLQGAQIVGVFGSGDAGGVLAMIQGRMQRVAKGAQVGEWLLKAVGDRDATFERKGESRAIRLTNAKLSGASGAVPVFQAAPPARPPDAGRTPEVTPAKTGGAVAPAPPPKAGGAAFGGSPAR